MWFIMAFFSPFFFAMAYLLPWWLRQWRIFLQCSRPGFDPGLGRSPGEGNGNPLQYSCLENSTDREAWPATVREVTKSQIRLSNSHCFSYIKLTFRVYLVIRLPLTMLYLQNKSFLLLKKKRLWNTTLW